MRDCHMKTADLHFPTRIPIGGVIYTLELREQIVHEHELVDGLCLFLEKKILLLVEYPTKEVAQKTFKHETNHGIALEYVVEISHTDLERLSQGQNQVDGAVEAARLELELDRKDGTM